LTVFTYGVKEVPATNEHDFRSPDELKSLFRDQQWLITRLVQDNRSYQGYLSDLIEAWKAADAETRQQIRNEQPPTSFADCVRYALIHTTIVGNLGRPSTLPSIYSDNGDTPLTAEFLTALTTDVPVLEPSQPSLETIATIEKPQKRAEALIQLAEHAAEEEREGIVSSAIANILAIQEEYWEFPSHLWERLQPYLGSAHFSQFARRVFESPNEVARAWFMSILAGKFDSKLMGKALDSAFSIADSSARTITLLHLVFRTRGKRRAKILQETYRSVGEIDHPVSKSRILVELVRKLTGKQRANIIRQAIATIPLMPGSSRGWHAYRLMPYLTRTQRIRLLKKVLSVKDLVGRIEACLTLWRYLPKSTHQQVFNMTLQLRDRCERAKQLARIAPKLRTKAAYQEAIQEIVEAIQEIRNEDRRRQILSTIQIDVQDEAIEQAAKLPVKRLTPDLEALPSYRFAFAQRGPQYIAYALGNLSASMDDALKARSLPLMVDLALEIDLHDYIAEAIERIAPDLDEKHLRIALDGALQIGENSSRVWALSGLAPFLAGEQLKICLREAVSAIGLLKEEDYQSDWSVVDMAARLLRSLKGRTRARLLRKGLAAAQTSDHGFYDERIRFLKFLEAEPRSEFAETIFGDVSTLPSEESQSRTLSSIAPCLPAHRIAPAIEIASMFKDDYEREGALSALIPYHPDPQLALEFAQKLEGPYRKSGALVKLLPRLTGELQTEALQLAMGVTEKIDKAGYRTSRWLDFLPLVEAQIPIRQKVIESMLDYLWAEKDSRRNGILALCAQREYVSEKILPVDVLKAMGEHVMEICMEWKWPSPQ
jgi:hypothetical protein